MIDFVAVRLSRRGKLVHAVSVGADADTITFCGKPAIRVVVAERKELTCSQCWEFAMGVYS